MALTEEDWPDESGPRRPNVRFIVILIAFMGVVVLAALLMKFFVGR